MAFQVKFLSLQKTELEYEVTIRGASPAPTVQDLRKQIAKLGPLFPSEDILESPLDPVDDLRGVGDTLTKVKLNLDSEPDRNVLLRTQNLLNHLHHRLNRIISNDVTKAQYDAYNNIFNNYFEIFKTIKDKKSEPLTSSNIESSTQPSATPVNVSVTCDRGVSADFGKFKYDGRTCVRAFIQRINEFCEARNIPDSKVLSYATEIFTGDALHWFRSVRDRVSKWSELIALLQQDFSQSDFDYRLLSEIRSRTQGETENITIYLSIMSGLFSRLSKKIPEEDKLEIIFHNIRPCYASTLASANEIKTLDSLRTLCRNYENIQARLANFHEPAPATSTTLAPEFAYNSNKNRFGNKNNTYKQNYNTNNNSFSKFNKNYTNYNQNKNFPNNNTNNRTHQNYVHAIEAPRPRYCPRCRVDSHNLRQCTENKTDIYCFKCGLKNVKTPQCPECNKSKPTNPKN